MNDRKRLLLHIGTHKTGTSTLQRLMAQNRARLAVMGVCYPRTDRPPRETLPKHGSFVKALTGGKETLAQEMRLLHEELALSGAHTLLLSAEGLSGFGTGKRRQRFALAQDLAEEFDIEVVCFLRRQDSFVESFWNQRCKSGREQAHVDAFARATMLSGRLDYSAMLDFWAGFARVTAIGFERACEAGLVESFNKATGLSLPPETQRRNVRTAAIMAVLNRRGVAHDWRKIDASLGGPRQRHALGARLRAEIMARCASENAELARRYGVLFPDDIPEEPDGPLPEPDAETLFRLQAAGLAAR